MIDTDQLTREMHQSIPITRSMDINVLPWKGSIQLTMPVEPNVNHQGTIFGGSQGALCAATGFLWVTILLRDHQIDAEVVITRSEVSFLAPLAGTGTCRIEEPSRDEQQRFLQAVEKKGKGKLELAGTILLGETVTTRFTAVYAAMATLL